MAKKLKFLRSKKGLLMVVVVVVAASGVYVLHQHNRPKNVVTTSSGVNLAPATEQEKQESADSKDKLSQPAPQPTTISSGKKQVTITITYVKADSIRAYATGVFEDGGVCTATFIQGTTTVTRTSSGFENVSYTQCAPITPNLPNTGTWTVVVSYNSSNATGTSQSQTL